MFSRYLALLALMMTVMGCHTAPKTIAPVQQSDYVPCSSVGNGLVVCPAVSAPVYRCLAGCGDRTEKPYESNIQTWQAYCNTNGSGQKPDGTLYCFQDTGALSDHIQFHDRVEGSDNYYIEAGKDWKCEPVTDTPRGSSFAIICVKADSGSAK